MRMIFKITCVGKGKQACKIKAGKRYASKTRIESHHENKNMQHKDYINEEKHVEDNLNIIRRRLRKLQK